MKIASDIKEEMKGYLSTLKDTDWHLCRFFAVDNQSTCAFGYNIHGKRTGRWILCDRSGTYWFTGQYVNDQKQGPWKEYTKTVNIIWERPCQKDNSLINTEESKPDIDDDQKSIVYMSMEAMYNKDQLHGPYSQYKLHALRSNGSTYKSVEGAYVNGLKEGRWTTYYYESNIMSRGLYKQGRKTGLWLLDGKKQWYVDDTLTKLDHDLLSKLVYQSVVYHKNLNDLVQSALLMS